MDMEFVKMRNELNAHFKDMTNGKNFLYLLNVDKEKIWDTYLESFKEGDNPIYLERREYDCSCCRHFIKTIGRIGVIKNGKFISIWDFNTKIEKFKPVIEALSKLAHKSNVRDVFITKFNKHGVEHNFGMHPDGRTIQYDHFYLEVGNKFVHTSYSSEAERMGELRAFKDVFKRSLEELTVDATQTTLELISQGSLYKGDEWKTALNKFLKHQKEYIKLESDKEKDLYAWENALGIDPKVSKIRNTSMGTLLIDISNNVELDRAVKAYEIVVAPSNYKRSKPIFTKRMLEDAQKKIEELGYMDSLGRRFANIEDITVNNVLFVDRKVASRIKNLNVFDEMKEDIAINPKKFSKVEEITIDKFMNDVLPLSSSVEVLFENRLAKNLVSLIAPKNNDSKTMFKWDNNFGWAYKGNITDSEMKKNVAKAGGKVDGDFRFSIQWNDGEKHERSDLDAHCDCPIGHIYYGNKMRILDVDIIDPEKGIPAVENITMDKGQMRNGEYKLYVKVYSLRSIDDGFSAEIELDGELYSFEYNQKLRSKQDIHVATVVYQDGEFTMKDKLSSSMSSKDIWGIKTATFVPVSSMMFSPNYWDEQKGIGNKHYMFMLEGCVNDESPNGFYMEFMNSELNKHRKVLEALGSKLRVEDTDNQLSGLGFSTTQRESMIIKVKGSTERILKIKF